MSGIRRAVPNLVVEDAEAAKAFFGGFLGFEVAMDEPGFVMYRSPGNPTAQITTADLHVEGQDRGIREAAVSVEVEDAAALHEQALAQGFEVVYPLTDEPWGIRRFFVRAPGGHVINVAQHL
jgi:catechol 2,3-dioxygenase-like lactoylglutathione lyase family enzyme